MIARISLSAIAVFAFLLGVEAQAQDTYPKGAPTRPIWELGVAAGGFYSPDYPAADKFTTRTGSALFDLSWRFFTPGRR